MNSKSFGKNRIPMQILVQIVLCLGLIAAVYAIVIANPIQGSADSQRSANSTKTALAMTAGSLLGPFPTATVPTATASDLPTITSTLPSATPTVTRTLTPTRTPVTTFIPRTREVDPNLPNPPATSIPPTSVPPTNPPPPTEPPPPTDPPTEPPPPTDPPATQPPIELPPVIPPFVQTLVP